MQQTISLYWSPWFKYNSVLSRRMEGRLRMSPRRVEILLENFEGLALRPVCSCVGS